MVTCVSHFSKINRASESSLDSLELPTDLTARPVGISSILLTVMGFVVGLCLSFRCSTAYEKYAEGRRYWAQLILASQSLARVFWVHSLQREGEDRETDMLSRLWVFLPSLVPWLACLFWMLTLQNGTQPARRLCRGAQTQTALRAVHGL